MISSCQFFGAKVLAKKALNAFPKLLLEHSYIGGTACYQAHPSHFLLFQRRYLTSLLFHSIASFYDNQRRRID
jgi:hypothetical protein